jgi:S-adenosylmethionine hydrolase
MTRPIVTLLTDFGLRDPSAAICKAVVLGICPDAEVIDLAHDVRKYAIGEGALALWAALPYVPVGTHVAVVDPGVGTARRPVALQVARGDVLVGPDNGLLAPAAERLGGIVEARELANEALRLPVVSSTFHGRDVFAPAAGHLAAGVAFEALGPVVEPSTLVPSTLPAPRAVDGGLAT